jgi:hypothetical protein
MKHVFALVVFVACGASTAEVTAAKTAEYKSSAETIFDLAIQAAQETYKIGEVDGPGHRFATAPQFYSAEGGRESPGAGDVVQVRGGSILLALIVEVDQKAGGGVVVAITPKTFQVVSGSPKPRELKPDDPNLPPWVHGRVDALSVAIYERAKGYEIGPASK